MLSISELSEDVAAGFLGLFCDIDDTLTTDGKLPAVSYQALWRLYDLGIQVIPVTGRPAGWCDLIVRQWPVTAVVGENGAFALWQEGRRLQRLLHPDVADPSVRQQLRAVERAVLSEVHGSRVAQDQPYRLFDLAIDFCEEPPDLGMAAAERIAAIFAREGANAKISSIHVNGWFGAYDKLAMVRLFLREHFGVSLDDMRENYTFCGDSPNDEPMFAYFPHACGVANVTRFLGTLKHKPRYVTPSVGGQGFAEWVDMWLKKARGR